ncbi:MAG: flagellar hook-basal body complex protein FliE [Phycisphaeraceae bacterium]|nr:flagellar hook-basal body complex protein FliE [Phycisphaeraceae bacterium]
MSDPLGLIGAAGGALRLPSGVPAARAGGPGPSFKETLLQNIDQVNQLQQDATRAIEDLATGDRDDVEGVILATQKADSAFKMLQAVRNKVVEAYQEINQVRV